MYGKEIKYYLSPELLTEKVLQGLIIGEKVSHKYFWEVL